MENENKSSFVLDLTVKAVLDAAPGFSGFSTGTLPMDKKMNK